MTNNNTHNPGHTIGGGYPFNGIASRANWSNRPDVDINDQGKVVFDPCDVEYVETVYDRDFFMFRMVEFAEALKIAETQIEDMLTDDPFSPELLGFELAHMNTDITMPPVTIFVSRYDDKYTLVRDNGELGTDTWDPARWILMEKLPDGSFKNTTLYLSCQRIAYAAFSAMGVKMRGYVETVVRDVIEEHKHDVENVVFSIGNQLAHTEYEIRFKRLDERCCINIDEKVLVKAFDKEEALEFAKKFFEGRGAYYAKIYPEELSVINEPLVAMQSPIITNGGLKSFVDSIEENTSHRVEFYREMEIEGFKDVPFRKTISVNANSDKEALTKAKFLLETDPDNPFLDVKFEELTIVK